MPIYYFLNFLPFFEAWGDAYVSSWDPDIGSTADYVDLISKFLVHFRITSARKAAVKPIAKTYPVNIPRRMKTVLGLSMGIPEPPMATV